MNLYLVSMSHVFFRAIRAVFSSKAGRLSLPCLVLAGCVSHAPQSAISGKQEDKWPDNQLADFLSTRCDDIWNLSGHDVENNPLFWLRGIDCAQRLAPVDARSKAAMLDEDTWQDAFKRGILLADAKITPVERRANVTRLVKAAHDAVKAADPTLRFGVSPQGNPDNDRNEQYTDLSVWLTASGADAVVDYLCPQIYWGYGYTLSSGSSRFAFENITAEWLALPRAESTALYFGLGAYRVGVGDGGANADSVSQWCTGSALARQVTDLRSAGAGGWALYRYGSLFRSDESGLAAAERAALTALDG